MKLHEIKDFGQWMNGQGKSFMSFDMDAAKAGKLHSDLIGSDSGLDFENHDGVNNSIANDDKEFVLFADGAEIVEEEHGIYVEGKPVGILTLSRSLQKSDIKAIIKALDDRGLSTIAEPTM